MEITYDDAIAMSKAGLYRDLYAKVFSEQWANGLSGLPSHMVPGLVRYIVFGIPPGDFLQRVMANDLLGAFGRADDENRLMMGQWASFLYNYAPMGCRGSEEHLHDWCAAGGVLPKPQTEEAS